VPQLSELDRVSNYARWFIQLRWIAIILTFVLVVATIWVFEFLPKVVWWPLVLTVLSLAALNLGFVLLQRLKLVTRNLLALQAYADLMGLTVLLHFSGSLENPLAPLMLFHVIIAGIILPRLQCYMVALFGGTMYAILAGVELQGLLPHYTLQIFPHVEHEGEIAHAAMVPVYVLIQVAFQYAILFLSAFFVSTLSEQLREGERQIEKNAERILTERQLLEQALETTGTGLSVWDQQLSLFWHNVQWDTWFGRVSAESTLHSEISGPESSARKTVDDGLVRVLEVNVNKGITSVEAEFSDDGHTFRITTAPLHGQDGEISHVVQLAQDTTEQKRTQIGLMRAGKLAAVGELAGEIAHEVNNPVAIISAKSRLLLANQRNDMSNKVAEELNKITAMADRIARITQGLLSYSRTSVAIRAGLDIRIPIRRALSLVEHRAKTSSVVIEDLLPDDSLIVLANADEMEQIFLNLFLNSLDAMAESGRLTISAATVSDDSLEHSILVEDTGSGISKEMQESVFEPFFTTKAEGKGTGLGLSICLGLVRSHGGSIELNSEPGQGTQITVKLPKGKT
jgi:C4-dicarboxylate-specific signal transduction histidine kinase